MHQIDVEQDIIESVIYINKENFTDVSSKLTEYLRRFKNLSSLFVERLIQNALSINPKHSDLIVQLYESIQQNIDSFENCSCKQKKNDFDFPNYKEGTLEKSIFDDDLESFQKLLHGEIKAHCIPLSTLFPYLFPSAKVDLLQLSALCGSIECFKYLILNDEESQNIELYAAAGGNEDIINIVKNKGGSFAECIEVCIAYHRNNLLKTLIEETTPTKIPASIFLKSLNEKGISIMYDSLGNVDIKYTLLEEILDNPDSKQFPTLHKSISFELKHISSEFREYIKEKYISSYKSNILENINLDDLDNQGMKSADFKLAVFFRVKGIGDNVLGNLLTKQDDEIKEKTRLKQLERAKNLIAVGDIKHIFLSNGNEKKCISSLEDIIHILSGWKEGVTVFNMQEQLGDIKGHTFKQRVQKSGLCYMHAVVVYLYYAVRRNNKQWNEVIDMSEMIKTKFSWEEISDYILNDCGGSTYELLRTFARSIEANDRSSYMPVMSISPSRATEELFIQYGPFVLSGFKVYNDFSSRNEVSYTDDSFPEGELIGLHAMLVIGIRTSSDGNHMFLVQNWWEEKQIVEMSSKYLENHNASFLFLMNFHLRDYKYIDITSTTVSPFIETTVDTPEKLLRER